ncbi:MAG: cobalt-precorrin-6A reductase [Rhodospirillales bacterium RIFCSPLOWO2_12_FULL_58_28]|nr:MAG: cobalt-precorrin-6A reductase [Rhodospirillales bacterium RIFCSPLOWO2_02_FULL_58_16]OHC78065.1 MAG: cobalt-precorrin-6A reductase [Rhodospirillales bacterium RIFCSPLOWO2_12_FULL_58_28]
MVSKLLILGGVAEAADLARKASVALKGKVEVITSLAGRLKHRPDIPGRVRFGGFGGVEGLIDYLKDEAVDFVIDATHPFAETISGHAYVACLSSGVPRLSLIRPPWQAPPHAKWIEMDSLEEVASALPRISRRAFLTVGKGGIEAFSTVKGVWFLVRLIEEPDAPLPLADYQLVTGRPPHTVESERALIDDYGIDALIAKQSGGHMGEAKIIAACEAGIAVVAVSRPPPEPGESVETAEEAMAWLKERLRQ